METAAPLTAADLREFVLHIDVTLEHLRTEMREGFARVETRVQQVEMRVTRIETRLDHIDTRLDHLDMRLNQLDSRLGRLEGQSIHLPTVLAGMTAGIALIVSLVALWH